MIHDLTPVRRSRARDDMRAAGVEAFVVTHLPNLRYLTGFSGTAGAAILTPERCVLVVDSRYVTVARELLASRPDDGVALEVVDRGYDEAIAAVLERSRAARIGIEAASMPVSRFNWLSAQLASTRSDSEGGSPALVPTERLIEARRVVKDAAEVATLREAARRLSGMARAALGFAREGRTELAVAGDIDVAMRAGRLRAPGVRDHRRVGPQQRPAARAAGWPDAPAGRRGGAGLRGRLRRILRGSYPDRVHWRSFAGVAADRRGGPGSARGGSLSGAARRAAEPDRRRGARSARGARARRRVRSRNGARPGARSARRAANRASCPGPTRTRPSCPAWSSPSSRAPTSTGSAACGSKTTCWSWTAAARS